MTAKLFTIDELFGGSERVFRISDILFVFRLNTFFECECNKNFFKTLYAVFLIVLRSVLQKMLHKIEEYCVKP